MEKDVDTPKSHANIWNKKVYFLILGGKNMILANLTFSLL